MPPRRVCPTGSQQAGLEKLLWIPGISKRDSLVEFISRMRHSASNLRRGDDHDQICVRYLWPDETDRPGMAARASGRERRRPVGTERNQHPIGMGRAAGCASDGCAFLLRTMQRKVCEQAVQQPSGGIVGWPGKLVGVTNTEGCPALRVLCEGREPEMLARWAGQAAGARNEILPQPSFTRTRPASFTK
jgi:hypothetical protein